MFLTFAPLTSSATTIPGTEQHRSGTCTSCLLFVATRPLPRDGGTAQKAIQVHAVNLIEIRLGKRWQHVSNRS